LKALDWFGRAVMLVLAGMVTLSIIGSIAAIPSGSIENRIGMAPAPQPLPPESEQTPEPSAVEPIEGNRSDRAAAPAVGQRMAAPVPEPTDRDRWLEAITYALLALAGLVALGCLLLWRGLRRLADEVARARP
jgi:hypothetical protein